MWIDYTDQDFEGYFIDSDGKIEFYDRPSN